MRTYTQSKNMALHDHGSVFRSQEIEVLSTIVFPLDFMDFRSSVHVVFSHMGRSGVSAAYNKA